MTDRIRWTGKVLALAATTALALTACGSGGSSDGSAAGQDGGGGVVPAPLSTIEAGSEDIIDIAPSGEWERIQADVESIASAWEEYLASPDGEGAPAPTRDAMSKGLQRLQDASAAKHAAAVMQASNDVSAEVVELFALYDPLVPADVGRLDVLGRQVVLDATRGDLTAAAASLQRDAEIWTTLRARVVDQGGSSEAEDFDASIVKMQEALDAGDGQGLIDEAAVNLELVDALERVF